MPPCGVAQFARVLTIWRLLRASLHRGALPDSMMLASSTGCHGRRVSELAALKQADTLSPPLSPMLGAEQREIKPEQSQQGFPDGLDSLRHQMIGLISVGL